MTRHQPTFSTDTPRERDQLTDISRRRLLQSGSVATALSLTGCLDAISGSSSSVDGTVADESPTSRALEMGLDVRPAVVRVGSGTGWFVKEGVVMTCSHVIQSDTVPVHTFGGERLEGEVLGRHPNVDIALVECDLDTVDPLGTGHPPALEKIVDHQLIQVGNPAAVGSWIISTGTMERVTDEGFLADIPCGPGSSGSPIVTLDGQLVGTALGITASVERSENRSKPERVYAKFPGQRLLTRAAGPETIERCLEQLR